MVLEFACKRFEIDEVLKCSFGLNKTEFLILKKLLSREKKVDELSSELGKDKSTIQRSLQKMLNKGIVKRSQRNLKKGGYVFYYKSINKQLIKEHINKLFENFRRIVNKTINEW